MGLKNNIKKSAKYHGYDEQSRQLIEEMAELTQAINKYWRYQLRCGKIGIEDVPFGTIEEFNIAEEIADVEICLEQIKYLLDCEEDVRGYKEDKVKRELHRIGLEK